MDSNHGLNAHSTFTEPLLLDLKDPACNRHGNRTRARQPCDSMAYTSVCRHWSWGFGAIPHYAVDCSYCQR